MRCKPGDLVRYVGTPEPQVPNIYGWIGKAVRFINTGDNGGWLVDPPIYPGKIFRKGEWMRGDVVVDDCLSPIRDPGDDARDETLDWLPVPTTKKEETCSTS